MSKLASRCSVVLVETTEGGNIGSACRALMNCGFDAPVLVDPRASNWDEARKMAVHAAAMVDSAPRVPSLAHALDHVHWVVGISARSRKHQDRKEPMGPASFLEKLAALPNGARAALVFGTERTGLTNEQLGLCQDVLTLPTDPAYPSMNLAQAVMAVCWTIRMADVGELSGMSTTEKGQDEVLKDMATADDIQGFLDHAQRTLSLIGFLDYQNPRLILDELRKVLSRAALDRRELRIFRGIFHRMDLWIARHGGPPTPNQPRGKAKK